MAKTRIMYIEDKSGGLVGDARIGRVSYSKRGRTIRYDGREFLISTGYKSNYFCLETGTRFWISGPRKDGVDGLYGYRPTPIDEDAREEYWTLVRGRPDLRTQPMS